MRSIFALLSLFLFLFCCQLNGQSINELKKKQSQAKQKIELTNKLLSETQKNQKTTVSSLTVLKKQISEREDLISSLNTEITVLDGDLSKLEAEKQVLQDRLRLLQAEYANLVYHAYFFKNKYNQYLFIFSSESFSQAYRRLRYVQQYSRYRKEQSMEIMKVADQVHYKEMQMTDAKIKKEVVLKGKEAENQQLQQAKVNQQKMLSDLTKQEKKLRDDLKTQQKQVNELNNKIDQLIAKEIAEAERKANEKRKREKELAEKKRREQDSLDKTKKSSQKTNASITKTVAKPSAPASTSAPVYSTLTKEEGVISGSFEKNVGRLPWPARGVITGHFGVQNHPVLEHVQVNNKGIYIQTEAGADACAVFEGEVTQVFAIPGSNNAVIVKHGNFRSVYANLTSTFVRVGSKVNAHQRIGKIYVDVENNSKTELYFMLYKGSELENPERWLSR